jgi:hypothetical protein
LKGITVKKFSDLSLPQLSAFISSLLYMVGGYGFAAYIPFSVNETAKEFNNSFWNLFFGAPAIFMGLMFFMGSLGACIVVGMLKEMRRSAAD